MGHKRPTPQHLPAKLQAIRESFGVSQYRLSKFLQVGRTRLSAWEWGRRMPSWFVLIRYANSRVFRSNLSLTMILIRSTSKGISPELIKAVN